MDTEGAVRLAAAIIKGICRQYKDMYRIGYVDKSVDDFERYSAIASCATLERQICSPYFSNLSLGQDPDYIIQCLKRQVIEEEERHDHQERPDSKS